MFYRYTTLLVLLGLLVGCAPLAAIAPAAKGAAPRELTVIYTGFGRGNVDPVPDCDWTGKESLVGGLARRATAVKQLRDASPNALVVDTGGTLLGASAGADPESDRLIARVLGDLGYDVLNAGPGELLAGPIALQELADGKPALVSANASLASSGAPSDVLKPYVVKQVGGARIAIVGVTAGGLAGDGSVEPTKAPIEALRALLPEIKAKSDVVVVLADVEASSVRELSAAGLGVAVIIGARSVATRAPVLIGEAVVANAGGKGKAVDRLTIKLTPEGKAESFDFVELLLDDSVADDPGVLQLRGQY